MSEAAPRGLAIETSGTVYSLAACCGADTVTATLGDSRDRSRSIYVEIGNLINSLSISLKNLNWIAFGQGPGGFTGLRIGAAVAKTLAYACDLPVFPVSSLQAIAAGEQRRGVHGRVYVCQDARMGQIYGGLYELTDGAPLAWLEDALMDPAEVMACHEDSFVGAGSAWTVFPEMAASFGSRLRAINPGAVPQAEDILRLAVLASHTGHGVSAASAGPSYLRNQVTNK